jgi:hypothetical protein
LIFFMSMPGMWPSLQIVCALSTIIATTSIDKKPFLLPFWLSPRSSLRSAS